MTTVVKPKIQLGFFMILMFFFNQAFASPPLNPTITSFTPSTGSIGTLVTISGSNLSSPTALAIGGVSAITISNNGSVLVAMVMPGATTGAISITTSNGTASSSSNFSVLVNNYPSVQQGSKLVGTGSSGFPILQGSSVCLSADGNTAVVGGFYDNNGVGAVWVFTRNNGIWSQQGTKLVGSGGTITAAQGRSVSISADGNTLLIGGNADNSGQGAAWVFIRSGGIWSQQGSKLVGTGNSGGANQGYSVSLSADGNTAIVGGIGDDSNIGATWVFTRNSGVWSQQGSKLVGTGSSGSAKQGNSVCLSSDGNTAVVGGNEDNSGQGAIWVFTRSGSTWSQQGSKIVGTGNSGAASQGSSVAVSADGNTLVYGGFYDNSEQGATWIFTRSSGTWSQQGSKLVGSGNSGSSMQGAAVSLNADGNILFVGGPFDNGGKGATWVFARNGSIWSQQGDKLVASGLSYNASQGNSISVSADGNTLLVGANQDNNTIGASCIFTTPPNWTGAVSTNWGTSENWNPANVPNGLDSVIIGTSSTNPVLSTFQSVKSLLVKTGATLTITDTLQVSKSISNLGQINASAGTLVLNGSEPQTIASNTFYNKSVKNLIVNNSTDMSSEGVILADSLYLTGTLTMQNGVLQSAGYLVLKATASGTARVAEISSGFPIWGKVSCEYYIPAGRKGFRLMSHPFNGSLKLNQLIDDIHITGTGGATNGFDPSSLNNPSAFSFSSNDYDVAVANSGWVPFTNASSSGDEINQATGFRVLYRGPRSQSGMLDGSNPAPQACVLDLTSANSGVTFNQGGVSFPMSYSNSMPFANSGWNLIGNPYPSNYDLGSTAEADRRADPFSGIAAFAVWNPNNGTRGAYTSVSFASPYVIQAGSAFFVQTGSTFNSFNFYETQKTANAPGAVLLKTNPFKLNAMQIDVVSDSIYWDKLEIRDRAFGSDQKDQSDAPKMKNPDVNLYSIAADGQAISIDNRKLSNGKIVPLAFDNNTDYHFTFKVSNLDFPGYQVQLVDKYLNVRKLLSVNSEYYFTTNQDVSSKGKDRFELVFSKVSGLNEALIESNFVLSPNPASTEININLISNKEGNFQFIVLNQLGQEVIVGSLDFAAKNKHKIDIENLNNGVYFIQLYNQKNTQTIKFVK